jgi:hypothetical protein
MPLTPSMRTAVEQYIHAGGKLYVEQLSRPYKPATPDAPPPGEVTCTFEPGDPLTPKAFPGISFNGPQKNIKCALQPAVGHNGTQGLVFSGETTADTHASAALKLFDIDRPVTPKTRLSFWILPKNGIGRQACIDIRFDDNQSLSAMGAIDRQGKRLTADIPRGTVDKWVQVDARIGRVCSGQTIKNVAISFASQGNIGSFECVIDDVRIYEGEIDPVEESIFPENIKGAITYDIDTTESANAWNDGYSADSWWPIFVPTLEKHAKRLRAGDCAHIGHRAAIRLHRNSLAETVDIVVLDIGRRGRYGAEHLAGIAARMLLSVCIHIRFGWKPRHKFRGAAGGCEYDGCRGTAHFGEVLKGQVLVPACVIAVAHVADEADPVLHRL